MCAQPRQGYGNPFIHHITWGIALPSSLLSEDPAGSLISRIVQIRKTISGLLNETPGTLIIALPREVVQGEGFQEQFHRSTGSTPREQYQLEVMEGGGYLLQFFVLKGGRIALRSRTNQTFNPKSIQKISKDELSVDQGHSASTIKMLFMEGVYRKVVQRLVGARRSRQPFESSSTSS